MPNIMLTKTGESGHPLLVPNLQGKAFHLSSLSMMFSMGLLQMAFITLK